jgi:F0F1-type ATP synthase membrane subunit b/b'
MSDKIADSVEAMEAEAEKMLQEARTRASEIVLAAREEAKAMLSASLPMDDVRAECDRIVSKARVEADQTIRDAEKRAAEIAVNAESKLEEMAKRLAGIVGGRS